MEKKKEMGKKKKKKEIVQGPGRRCGEERGCRHSRHQLEVAKKRV